MNIYASFTCVTLYGYAVCDSANIFWNNFILISNGLFAKVNIYCFAKVNIYGIAKVNMYLSYYSEVNCKIEREK